MYNFRVTEETFNDFASAEVQFNIESLGIDMSAKFSLNKLLMANKFQVAVRLPLLQTIDENDRKGRKKKKAKTEDVGNFMQREIGYLDIELNLQ